MVSLSVLIITHGREELLLKCLESLRPAAPFELVLFANGLPLTDNLKSYLSSYPGVVKLSGSDVQLTPGASRNLAGQLVTGEWVHLIDDDSYWMPGYWENVKNLLHDKTIEVLGGPDGSASPVSYFQESVSITLSSPLCTGVTFARHKPLGRTMVSATEQKLTSCNLWLRSELLKKYPFPEDFRRAEETVFLLAIEKNQHRMFYHPLLKVGHFRRKNLRSLLRPTLAAGYWRSRLLRTTKGKGRVFWLPAIFVLLHVTVLFDPGLFGELAKVYSVMVLTVSMGLSSRKNRFWHFPLVAVLHYMIVFFYGAGFLLERSGYKWKS